MATFMSTVFSHVMEMNTHITVLTPKRFTGEMRELKVVYMLHGLSENNTDWQDKACLTMLCDQYGLAFVLPEVQRCFYTDMEYGINYFTYITEELPEICRRCFGLCIDRDNSYIFGTSMGGYGALKSALSKPHKYKACCAFSSVCDIREWIVTYGKPYAKEYKAIWGMELEHLDENDLHTIAKAGAANPIKTKLYMASGTEDFLHHMNVSFREYLKSLGYDLTYEQWQGSHEWVFWNEAIVRGCKAVFGEPPRYVPPAVPK